MKYLVFSDLHGNYDSLSRLPKNYDRAVFLGDICEGDVEKSRKCIDQLSGMKNLYVVPGGHDLSIFDDVALERYVKYANAGRKRERSLQNVENALKMRNKLGEEYIKWLKKWDKRVLEHKHFGYRILMVHDCLVPLTGKESQKDVGLGGYNKSRIVSSVHAAKNFNDRDFDLLLHGHTHVPSIWKTEKAGKNEVSDRDVNGHIFNSNGKAEFSNKKRYIACPGSMAGDSGYALSGVEDVSMSTRKCSYAVLKLDDVDKERAGTFSIRFLTSDRPES